MVDTLGGYSLGNIQSEVVNQSAGVVQIALPDSESSATLLIPTTGPTLKVQLNGIYTGDLSSLQTWVAILQDWISKGGQLSEPNITLITSLNFPSPGISVRVIDGSWNWDAGNPKILRYNLTLLQGTFG